MVSTLPRRHHVSMRMLNEGWGRHRWAVVAAGVVALFIAGIAVCEAMGWPFLAAPTQRWLSTALDRHVVLSSDVKTQPDVKIHLLGSVRLNAAHVEIGAPKWSAAPHTLLARDAHLKLSYGDLWRAWRGGPLNVAVLETSVLDGQLERMADGRASWQFGQAPSPAASDAAPRMPTFGKLQVANGTLSLRDEPQALSMDARFSLLEGAGRTPAGAASAGSASSVSSAASTASTASSDALPASGSPPPGLQFHGKGQYRKLPLTVNVVTSGVLPIVGEDAAAVALPVELNAQIGRARMTFRGTATDAVNLGGLAGRFNLQGPSAAALGDPTGVTLPTTGPIQFDGLLAKKGAIWYAVLERIVVGSSRLSGAFTFDPTRQTPLLAGRLNGSKLLLADLGPAIGTPVRNSTVAERGKQAPARAVNPVPNPVPSEVATTKAPGRVLPDRPFDLPSLRAMDANILVDINSLDLGTKLLEPLKPMRTHLVLKDGVLALNNLDARTGQGNLSGRVQLDGRKSLALWAADLRWNGIRLERWIQQTRAGNAPPYLSGSLSGRARVEGQGKSTAAILGSLRGDVRMNVVNGSVSHLAIEAAGLDIAQALGVLIKGDDALPILCTVADLAVEKGVLKPRALVLDTTDSTVWVDGSISMATEALDLRLLVSPKDFSPLALRSPIHLKGNFGNPDVSIDKAKLGQRIGAAALLGLLNPIAAILPFFDIGDSDDASRGASKCRALSQRVGAKPGVQPPLKLQPTVSAVQVTPRRKPLEPSAVSRR